jgi:hypothetical protein
MELILESEKKVWKHGEKVMVRLVALNDTYEAVTLERKQLIGPNPVPSEATGAPMPVSVEPSFAKNTQNEIKLNPFCFYGRQRTYEALPAGKTTFYAYYLKRPSSSLLPQRPGKPEDLDVAAKPLVIEVMRE